VDGEVEGAVVGELADGRPHGGEARAGNGGGAADERLGGVVDAVLVEAEEVAAGLRVGALHGWPLHEVLDVGARELVDLLEDHLSLLLVERPHDDGGRREEGWGVRGGAGRRWGLRNGG
jgi:hypothetical protein